MFKPWLLTELQAPLAADLLGEDVQVQRVHTDTRTLQVGDLFVALQGEKFDGHEYLAAAEQAGAVAAVVDTWQEDSDLPQLIVADTRLALGQLGALNRQAFQGKLVALTGSSGKTTVKEMLASIGRVAVGEQAVLATRGNLNNDLGVPMTLLELAPQHQWAVIELGASRLGEIAYTRALAMPQVVLINNAGMAHAGEFGGPEQIVKAKGEILDGLDASATAILNKDDSAFAQWVARSSAGRVLSFAKNDSQADVYAKDLTKHVSGCYGFVLCAAAGEVEVQLTVPGEHNVSNALAAAAAAIALGVDLSTIAQGLTQMQPVAGRCMVHALSNDSYVIDDSYNANPASMRAAMDVLAEMPGERILLLGDMGELGQWAESEHQELGAYANGKADALYGVGTHIKHAVAAFAGEAKHFSSQQELLAFLSAKKPVLTSYLVKGSRSAAMEKVVAALMNTKEGGY